MATAAERFSTRLMGENDSTNVVAAATLAVALVSGGYYLYDCLQRKKKPWIMLPGRKPIIGHAHLVFPVKDVVSKWEKWAEEYGSETGCYEMTVFGRAFIVISSEERAMEIFKHRPYVALRPIQIKNSSLSIGSKSVFAAEGDQWKQEHKLVAPALNKANVNDYLSTFKVMAHRLVDKWSIAASKNELVNIGPDLGNIAADSIAKASLDRDFDFLNSESQVGTDIKDVMYGFVSRGMVPFCYWNIPIIGRYLDGLYKSIDRTTAMVGKVVDQYEKEGGDTSKKTFLQKVYTLMQSNNESIPRHRLVGNVVGLFLAGTDTTSKALLSALYLLAEDSKLQESLQKEADGIDLESMSLQDFFAKIPRIKSFLHEVHRWYGVPALGMYVTRDIPFCGTTLSKGIDVLVLSRSVSWQSSDVPRGPSDSPPNAFDPTRYLVTEADGQLKSMFPSTKLGGFLGFGHGVRSCPGRVYSEGLSYAILVQLLQTLSWTLKPGHAKPGFVFDVVMTPDCDIELVFTKRDSVKA